MDKDGDNNGYDGDNKEISMPATINTQENIAAAKDGKAQTSSVVITCSADIPSSSKCISRQTDNGDNEGDKPSCSSVSADHEKEELLQKYLKILQATDSIMEANIVATIKGFLRAGGQPETVINSLASSYRGTAQYCELLGDWLADLEGSRRVVQGSIENTMSTLLVKNFTPEVVDENFAAADDVDQWLPELLKHRAWRNLIYKLIEQHPRSVFLMKAIRMISESDFQSEITNVQLASEQLEIYCRMVLNAIDQFFLKQSRGPMTDEYEKALAELIRIACHSEHTYVFTQVLLHEVIKSENNEIAAACTYLAQILRCEAHKRNYQDTYDIHIALDNCGNEVKRMIYTMLSRKCLNQADIIRLFERYSSSEPPPVEFIQDSFFADMLIDALFSCHGNKVQSNHRSKYVYLLAYASCFTSDDTKEVLEKTKDVMEKILDSLRTEREFLKDFRLLLDGIEFPAIAAGLLHFLQGFLLSDEILSGLEAAHYVLLDEIATKHSGLHIRSFKLLCDLYDRQSNLLLPSEMIIAKQRSIIDRFVHLLSVGFALPVIEKINKLFQEGQIDVSLVRYFATDVLDIIESPYSEEFVETFAPIVLNEEIFDKSTLKKLPVAIQFIQDIKAQPLEFKNEESTMEQASTSGTR